MSLSLRSIITGDEIKFYKTGPDSFEIFPRNCNIARTKPEDLSDVKSIHLIKNFTVHYSERRETPFCFYLKHDGTVKWWYKDTLKTTKQVNFYDIPTSGVDKIFSCYDWEYIVIVMLNGTLITKRWEDFEKIDNIFANLTEFYIKYGLKDCVFFQTYIVLLGDNNELSTVGFQYIPAYPVFPEFITLYEEIPGSFI